MQSVSPIEAMHFDLYLYILLMHGHCFEGYGREYRDRLLGRWGIVDVNDCCSCAKFLVIAFFTLISFQIVIDVYPVNS